jgi:acetyl/propionyl-CoA carboxylase alpha subunit
LSFWCISVCCSCGTCLLAVRVETGVGQADTVSMHYDPMIAKLLVWGENRVAALVKLKDCLSKFEVYLITGLLVKVSGILDFRVASQQCDSLL